MIYLDSCIVIYLVEKHPIYYQLVEQKLRQHAHEEFAISPLVMLECLVSPIKHKDTLLSQRFEAFFTTVTRLSLNETVFRKAAEQRASFGTKTPDALHLATAEHYACSELWTNDNRLAKVSPLTLNVLQT